VFFVEFLCTLVVAEFDIHPQCLYGDEQGCNLTDVRLCCDLVGPNQPLHKLLWSFLHTVAGIDHWLFNFNIIFGSYMWVGNKILNNKVVILELYYLLIKYLQFQCLTLHTAIGQGNLVPLNTHNSANPLSVFSTPWTGHPQVGHYLLERSVSGGRIKLRCLASMAMDWWMVLCHLQALPLG
jgi:hypothetical protein